VTGAEILGQFILKPTVSKSCELYCNLRPQFLPQTKSNTRT